MALVCGGSSSPAQSSDDWGVGSTNLDKVQTFWQAVERSNGPVTVLALGDSMSDSYRSVASSLFQKLRARLGTAGLGYTDGYDTITPSFTGGAGWVEWNSAIWWARHCRLPVGDSISWTNRDYHSGAVVCDQVGLFWVAHPGGGSFTLSVSTNAGPWSQPLALLDGYAATPVGRCTNLPVARQSYWMRVIGLGGTNAVLAPLFLDRSSAGLNVAWMAMDGQNLNGLFSLSTNTTYPILAALNPQLVVWHMKEIGDIGEMNLSNRLYNLEAMWKACVTNGDVVYIGTPCDYRDQSTNYTPRETRLIKEAAARDGRAYVDCMSPSVSYSWMVAQGYMNDAIHPNSAGCAFLADIAWRQLGFFALRAERRLAFTPMDGALRLEWSSETNLQYELQSSTDLSGWVALQNTPGSGARQAYTNSTSAISNAFFRLRLSPR
jgi:hypothetical protein